MAGTRPSIAFALALALALALAPAMPLPLGAHEIPKPADRSGYAIASIDHGAMAVLERHRAAILDIARSARDPDPELAALLVFHQIQRANCLWLLVPGSITDEDNPFNLCAHAETAALKAILERLRLHPDVGERTRALISAIDADMVLAGTTYALCAFSGEAFNTAAPIRPVPGDVAAHLTNRYAAPTLLVILIVIVATGLRLARSRLLGRT